VASPRALRKQYFKLASPRALRALRTGVSCGKDTVAALPVGKHLITFTAQGQNRIAGTATVYVTVLAEEEDT
jgi:hypothetical protein